jgi:hypothetical protein
MIPLFTELQFKCAGKDFKLPLKCARCSETFYLTKLRIQRARNPKQPSKGEFCSRTCSDLNNRNRVTVKCTNCDTEFDKLVNQHKRSENHFCSNSCAATYNNKHKTTGTRRSKLEQYIEEQLTLLYPNVLIDYNKKSVIDSELDIYIPSINTAFELNGIFHYQPIYGEKKFKQIQENDKNKSKACADKKINLCIIDTSEQKRFTISSSKQYLDIIIKNVDREIIEISQKPCKGSSPALEHDSPFRYKKV